MLKARILSFKYAFQGVFDLFRSQPNARIHLAVTVLVICLGWYLGLPLTEWCLLALAIGLVLAAEAFNTALEYLTDLVSPDYHELAGKTKDVAAGGVLLAAIAAATVGLIIFIPRILPLLNG